MIDHVFLFAISLQTNDKQQVKPTLENLATFPKELGTITELIADSGYFSEGNISTCEDKGITPYIA